MTRTGLSGVLARSASSGDDALRSLLESSARGDEEAFAALFDVTAGSALAVARCVTDDEELAASATHRAYLEIWHRAQQGRVPQRDLGMWVLGVAHRHARQHAC